MKEKKKLLYEKPELIDFKKGGAFGGEPEDSCTEGSGAGDGCLAGSSAGTSCGDGIGGEFVG